MVNAGKLEITCWPQKIGHFMSNILHSINRGFLIVGFTGPLSSGCSTASDFFSKKLDSYIKKKTTIVLPKFEKKIKSIYKIISDLRSEHNKKSVSEDEKGQIVKQIRKETRRLKEYLDIRETLIILENYKACTIKHISMTDMLLKISMEHLLEITAPLQDELLNKFRNCFTFDESKYEKAKEVNALIKERNLHKITKADSKIYEEFLASIETFYQELKKAFSPNELGKLLQDLGDNARRCGNPIDFQSQFSKDNAKSLVILAEEANSLIKYYRYRGREKLDQIPLRKFVVEAFRNPYEIEFFRNRYYEFFLLSINAPLSVRVKRKNWNVERDIRDQGQNIGKSEFYKQNVSKCVYLSDISINNDSNLGRFGQKLAKYYALMNQPGCLTPSYDELFMHQAYSMSLKSNCISRQVGAIIVGPEGYIVGAGWNDVGSGQIPCGQRKISDLNLTQNSFPIAAKNEDQKFISFIQLNNLFNQHHSFCYKDQCSLFNTSSKTNSAIDLNDWIERNKISAEEKSTLSAIIQNRFSPKRLEYCRALHAEENAILQNAIIGGVGIKGGTIFTTTFPCELCAKKIYQAGIKSVVYTEPYPESISEDVFFKDGSHVVELRQFEGVKSHSYYRLFKANVDKKEFQFQETI